MIFLPFGLFLLVLTILPAFRPKVWDQYCAGIAFILSLGAWVVGLMYYPAVSLGHQFFHVACFEYIPFILFLACLYALSSALNIQVQGQGSLGQNVTLLSGGILLSNIMGTVGASLLLLPIILKINDRRRYKAHTIMAFIYLVGNIGGSLTPLGDPPLLLGYIHGVPFLWTIKNLWQPWIFMNGVGLMLYAGVDYFFFSKKESFAPISPVPFRIIKISGGFLIPIFFLVITAIVGISLSVWSKEGKNLVQCILLLSIIVLVQGYKKISWHPMREMIWIFFGLFFTTVPVLAWICGMPSLHKFFQNPVGLFWVTGILSSFLDNAPTYLLFFHAFGGQNMVSSMPEFLKALSLGTVYLGALTYIGNSPNLFIRTMTKEKNIWMPSFFMYMVFSVIILCPLFFICSMLFLV